MHVSDRIALDHLDRMTDSTGLIQHAIYGIPRRESGYTTDDNARALRLCARLWGRQPEERDAEPRGELSGLPGVSPVVPAAGSTISWATSGAGWMRKAAAIARARRSAPWPKCSAAILPDDYRALARELIEAVLPTLADLRSLRAQAYVILAWGHLWTSGVEDIEPLETRRLVGGAAAGGMLQPQRCDRTGNGSSRG